MIYVLLHRACQTSFTNNLYHRERGVPAHQVVLVVWLFLAIYFVALLHCSLRLCQCAHSEAVFVIVCYFLYASFIVICVHHRLLLLNIPFVIGIIFRLNLLLICACARYNFRWYLIISDVMFINFFMHKIYGVEWEPYAFLFGFVCFRNILIYSILCCNYYVNKCFVCLYLACELLYISPLVIRSVIVLNISVLYLLVYVWFYSDLRQGVKNLPITKLLVRPYFYV